MFDAKPRLPGSHRKPTWWVGPALSAVAVAISIGVLVYTLMGRDASAPDFVRLGPVMPGSVPDYLDEASQRLPARVLGSSSSVHTRRRARSVADAMLGARSLPTRVDYTISNGATLENVANLFGIYHHEITQLNEGVGLQRVLPAGTRVAVWRATATDESRSVGRPSSGTLEGAVPMMEGPGRILRSNRLKSWATASTVARLDWVLRQWEARYPDMHDVLVGNLSLRTGGRVQPHRTHQSGRDVDLSFVQNWDGQSEVSWREMNATNFDARGNWLLIELLAETDAIAVMFCDYSLQKLLYDYAIETGRYDEESLKQWMQYPDGQNRQGRVIQHAPGHVDHLHVRFSCRPDDDGCREDEH